MHGAVARLARKEQAAEPEDSGVAQVVAQASGAVFAVDERLRIAAWNRAAERGLGLPEAEVLGTLCYETVQAVDADTGRPCYEHCPLVHRSPLYGWVHSRALKAHWRGGQQVQLDCMLLRCVLPSAERGTLSFVTPLGATEAEGYLRAMSAIEALYPVLTRSTDLTQTLSTVVRAVLQATQADAAELRLLDPETREPFQVIAQTLEPGYEAQLERWLSASDLLELVTRSEEALVAFHPPADGSATVAQGLRWCLTIPLVAEERTLGALTVASQRAEFGLGLAARVLFAVGAQLSVFLRWALLVDQQQGAVASDGAEAAVLRFYTFGQFRVAREGQDISSSQFGRQKSLALLKLLVAHRGRPLRREVLIETLWPEANPSLAANNLRVVLHDLRHTLQPDLRRGQPSAFVLSRGDLVYLDPSEQCWTDVEAFERRARQFDTLLNRGRVDAALAAGREAAALYTAEYLADEPYTDWCIAERERLREVYIHLLQRMASLWAERNQVDEAIAACCRALSADGLREETHRQLMALLWKTGHRDEALRQYETCRRGLWRELEVAPDEETQLLYRAILSRRP